jgi:hypothetical protein
MKTTITFLGAFNPGFGLVMASFNIGSQAGIMLR